MHSRELIELAALASAHGPALLRSSSPFLAIEGLGQYWAASKCRLDRWSRVLRASMPSDSQTSAHASAFFQTLHQAPPSDGHLKSVLEEILTSEVLTRVWTAMLAAFDQRRGCDEHSPIARTILLGHSEARHRALLLLVHGPGVSSHDALTLNRLRRRAERWTDLLIGHLSIEHDVSEFSANPALAREFAEDFRHHRGWSLDGQAWPLAMASLRAAFRQGISDRCPNSDLNRQIAAGVLACLPPDLFDSTGLLQSLWMARITHAADDAQGLIAEMFAADAAPAHPSDSALKRGLPAGRERRRSGP